MYMQLQARNLDRGQKNCICNSVTRYIKGGRKAISLRLDPELLKALDALAEKMGNTNRTELLEEGARLILAKHAKADPKTSKR